MSIVKHVTLQTIVAHDFRYDPRICNIAPEDGLESRKRVEHPKIKTSCNNLCILLVQFRIAV